MIIVHAVRLLILSSLLAVPLLADIAKDAKYQHSAKAFAAILKNQHVSKSVLDDKISEKAFDLFFKKLDEKRIFFLTTDLEEFGKYRALIDDSLPKGDLEFPAEVFKRYHLRAKELLALATELLAEPVDFTIDEEVDIDFVKMPFPTTPEARRERIRKNIKGALLDAKLATPAESLEEIRKRLLETYETTTREAETIDEFDFLEVYFTAVGNAFDPHSDFFSPNTESQFQAQMRQKLYGIGVALALDNAGKAKVMELKAGGPAALDGRLKVGDTIMGITADTTNKEYLDFSTVAFKSRANLIRGKGGTKITLRVFRESDKSTLDIDLVRGEIKLEATSAVGAVREMQSGERTLRVGMIVLPEFYEDPACQWNEFSCKSAYNDVARILKEQLQNIDLLLFDLRNNPGGSLRAANRTVGHFIDVGPTVQIKGQTDKKLGDDVKGVLYAGPLAVIVNQLSASASEIFAAVIQDYRRGVVIGAGTFGKGSVQQAIPLSDPIQRLFFGVPEAAGLAKVSVDMYYRVTGKSTQKLGVSPDIVLPSTTLVTPEAEFPNVLEHRTIDPVTFKPVNSLTSEIVNSLATLSRTRVEASDDFKRYKRTIENRKTRSAVMRRSLNEATRSAQQKEPQAQDETRGEPGHVVLVPPPGVDPASEGINPDNFYNREILQIGFDLESALKAASAP